ncbi:hypothetical protein Dimus_021159 [Dionaea muscipula]
MPIDCESMVRRRLRDSLSKALPVAMKARNVGEELMLTVLIGGSGEKLREIGLVDEHDVNRVLDVYVHIGMFVPPPPVFGMREQKGASLAVLGSKRDMAQAKYADWARLRKSVEKMRPASITEALLSEDGDKILEGCRTNFFVVRHKELSNAEWENSNTDGSWQSYEVQTAPLQDGVLPGVTRKLVIEICSSKGIALREVSPSWSARETWEEAFITNSVKLVQHVVAIQSPKSWTSLQSKAPEDLSWEEKQFKPSPGKVTAMIQREIMEKADLEGYSLIPFSG